MRNWWRFQVDVPEGRSGDWEVIRSAVTVRAAAAISDLVERGVLTGRSLVPRGTYTTLRRAGITWMADSPAEVGEHAAFFRHARGEVLIFGLGLGMCAAAAARMRSVDRVTVVEKDPDVLALVAPHWRERFDRRRLRILQGDAFTYPVRRVDALWADVWPSLDALKNLPEMIRLRRRWQRAAGWIGCWGEAQLVGQFLLAARRAKQEGQAREAVRNARASGWLGKATAYPEEVPEDPYAGLVSCGGMVVEGRRTAGGIIGYPFPD